MQGATFNIHQQPVLPLSNPPSRKQLKKIAPLPIGVKIKSFKIEDANSSRSPIAKAVNLGTTVRLPNFVHSQPSPLDIFTDRIVTKSLNFCSPSYSQPDGGTQPKPCKSGSTKRFWWHWLLLVGSTILMLPILFQTSSQARNLLERAKVYLELNSQQATSMPDTGRIHLQNNQASQFNRAIRQARSIEPDSPFYQQAQADIIRWSAVILDIAQGRASQGDFADAIAAAKLVPQDETSVRFIAQQAAEAIEHWQLRAQRQNLYQHSLAEAKKLINPNQASSYNQAIRILRQISPGIKEYPEAQNLISQWSKQIYLIASHRAARGDFKQAIAAAALVPKDSPYYQEARNSMIRWKEFKPIKHSWYNPTIVETIPKDPCQCRLR